MAPDPVMTPPDTKLIIATDPAVDFLPTTSVMTPDMAVASPDQANFASLPREIRDEIYRLALPQSCKIWVTVFGAHSRSSRLYQILSLQASNSTYANEARAMCFEKNVFYVGIEKLQVFLGEDGVKYGFDVKPFLRDIVLKIFMDDRMDELAERISLLSKCPTLRSVAAILDCTAILLNRSDLKCAMKTIFGAFKALAEKLGRRLKFSLIYRHKDGGIPVNQRRTIEGLEKLEAVVHDEESDPEDRNS